MRTVLFAVIGPLVLAGGQARGDAVEDAVAHVRKLGGSVERDPKRAGNPVVVVTLAGRKEVTDEDLKRLAPLADVTRLNLSLTSVTAAGLKHLAPLKNLATLELNFTNMSGRGLKDLAALPNLTSLSMYSCRHEKEGLMELAAVTTLTALAASSSGLDLDDDVLTAWTALKGLKSLQLYSVSCGDAGLRAVARHTELDDLVLQFPRSTTPAGWTPLGRLVKLRTLSLAGGNVPRPEGGGVDDAVLRHFAGLTGLEKFELIETGVTDASLAWVGRNKSLTALRITNSNGVTDAGLKSLAGLAELTALDLSGSSVSDEGVKVMAQFQKLTSLKVNRTGISNAGAAELKKRLPNCRVSWVPRPRP